MKMTGRLLIGVALGGLLLGGCVSKVTNESQYSGFLPNYDGLQQAKSANGQPVMRWVAEGFDPHAYDTVVFNQLVLYPAPKPNERVNLKTLQELQAQTSASVKGALAKKYSVVSSEAAAKGRRALILNAAITGVSASTEGMQWYEVLPVTAVVGAASAAAGTRDQNTELYVEANLVDAASGKAVLKVVRKVFGTNLDNDKQAITANDFKEAIKGLGADVDAFIK